MDRASVHMKILVIVPAHVDLGLLRLVPLRCPRILSSGKVGHDCVNVRVNRFMTRNDRRREARYASDDPAEMDRTSTAECNMRCRLSISATPKAAGKGMALHRRAIRPRASTLRAAIPPRPKLGQDRLKCHQCALCRSRDGSFPAVHQRFPALAVTFAGAWSRPGGRPAIWRRQY